MKQNFLAKFKIFFRGESETIKPTFEEEMETITSENESEVVKASSEEKRKFFRVALLNPLISRLQITKVNGKAVQTNSTKVLVDEIGPGGLRFLSELDFPVNKDVVLSFEAMICGELIQVDGNVHWKKEKDGLLHYGIEFDVEDVERKVLTKQLNKLLLSLKKDGIYPPSNFYHEKHKQFFETRQRKLQ